MTACAFVVQWWVVGFGRPTNGFATMGVMAHPLVKELRDIEHPLLAQVARAQEPDIAEPLVRLDAAIVTFGKTWSGSNMGYQSRVYYRDFSSPPAGAHFDSEWGFLGQFQGTTGDWVEYQTDEVVPLVYKLAGIEDLEPQRAAAQRAHEVWAVAQPDVVSVLRTYLAEREDVLVAELVDAASKVQDLTIRDAEIALVGRVGSKMIRDTTAFSQGFFAAPHQQVEARLVQVRSAFAACRDLAGITSRAASHIERLEASMHSRGQAGAVVGEKVFIGHGQSRQWMELKDFVQDRMGLAYDEFNRVPVAGVTNIARLSEMLDAARIAFVVLTAEDETIDGSERARQNVVHEAGLFQGRLGFSRAIVLLEHSCDEFSNIQGLGQIRFPAGRINACFEEVRRVLEREGFVPD